MCLHKEQFNDMPGARVWQTNSSDNMINSQSQVALIQQDRNDKFGRFYIATRKILPGEVIFEENSTCSFPWVGDEQISVCISCYNKLELRSRNFQKCEYCDWPVCDSNCRTVSQVLFSCRYRQCNY